MQSLETFVFALVFSGKVGVYDGRTGIPGEKSTPLAEGLTEDFEERLKVFGKRDDGITVRSIDYHPLVCSICASSNPGDGQAFHRPCQVFADFK